MTVQAFRGEILAVPDDPARGGEIRHFPDGLLLVEDGIVVSCGPYAEPSNVSVERLPGLMLSKV